MSGTGLGAIRDAAREYVTALEYRRIARREFMDAQIEWDKRATATAEERCAEMDAQARYRFSIRRASKALARMERLLAVEPRVVRMTKEDR